MRKPRGSSGHITWSGLPTLLRPESSCFLGQRRKSALARVEGKHVLCEKMMAKSEADCNRMIEDARRNKRLLEIGYQRYYNPMYQAAYESIITQGVLGEVYHARGWTRGVRSHLCDLRIPGRPNRNFSSIQSNAFEDAYEMFMGTKGTLILRHETEAYLFGEGEGAATRVEVSRQSANPIVDASATRPADSPGRSMNSGTGAQTDRGVAHRNESSEFCAAIRTGGRVRCGKGEAFGDRMPDREQLGGAEVEAGDCRGVRPAFGERALSPAPQIGDQE